MPVEWPPADLGLTPAARFFCQAAGHPPHYVAAASAAAAAVAYRAFLGLPGGAAVDVTVAAFA
jgi:hypothetical protein